MSEKKVGQKRGQKGGRSGAEVGQKVGQKWGKGGRSGANPVFLWEKITLVDVHYVSISVSTLWNQRVIKRKKDQKSGAKGAERGQANHFF